MRPSVPVLLVAALAAAASGCGAQQAGPSGGAPPSAEQLRSMPGVADAAAGEFEASDGETRQTISVVDLEPDVTLEEMTAATRAVSGAGADFWAVYVGSDIDPEYPDDEEATGFSGADLARMPDPVDAVAPLLLARGVATTTTVDARARATWADGELALAVQLPRARTDDVTAVAEALAAEDRLAGGPLSVAGTGEQPDDGDPLEELVTAGTLAGVDGIDAALLERWQRLLDAAAGGGTDVRPVQVGLVETTDGSRIDLVVHLDTTGDRNVYSASGELLRPGDPGYELYFDDTGDPGEITTDAWGARIWPVADPVLDVAAEDDSTAVRLGEVRDPAEPLVDLEPGSARPGPDRHGRTWGARAWARLR